MKNIYENQITILQFCYYAALMIRLKYHLRNDTIIPLSNWKTTTLKFL